MKKLIRYIIKEETDQVENKKLSAKDRLKTIVDNFGLDYAAKAVGGMDNYVRIAFDGDLKKFYENTGYVPYKFDYTGENMYIDEMLIQTLNLEDTWDGKEKKLGDFRWISGGMNYRFHSYVSKPFINVHGQEFRRVAGNSGDHGFGHGFNSKKNTLGKRARMQIFKQVIDKYKLDSYK